MAPAHGKMEWASGDKDSKKGWYLSSVNETMGSRIFVIPSRNTATFVVLGLAVVALSHAGVFDSMDDWFFDRLVARSSALSSALVLVIATDRELEREEVLDLADRLSRQGVRLSAFVGRPDWLADASLASGLSERNALVVAGDLGPMLPRSGIWRRIGAGQDGGRTPSPVPGITPIADQLGLAFPEADFHLDFKVRREGLQRVVLQRVLDGDLPRSLVEGKVVLVGRDESSLALVSTPVHQGAEALSPVLFQALVADALLRDGFVEIASTPIQWVVALGLVALFVAVCSRWRSARALWIAAGFLVITVAAAGIGLWLFQWWMPPGKGVALLCVAAVAMVSYAAAKQRSSLSRALRNLAVDAQERAEHNSFLTSASPWAQVEAGLDQVFGFESSFVLSAVSGNLVAPTENGRALAEQYLASSLLRAEEEPFSTAVKEGHAKLGDGLVVIPIGGSARLFGFWVFASPDEMAIEQASAYAARLAAMFEQRDAWRECARPHQLDDDGEAGVRIRPLHDQLEGSIDLLDGARKVLADALDRSTEAVLVYDPFGKLVHTSRRSVELLGAGGIEYTQVAPVDLLAELTGIGGEELRRALRFVALNGEQANFKASAQLAPGREFFALVRPMPWALAGGGGEAQLPGLLLLIQDVTQTARAALLKDEFIERIYFQLNNDFEAIVVASSLLDDTRVAPEERAELLTMINEKIEQASGRVKETRSHLQTEFSPVAVERYPVRFEPVLGAARAALSSEFEARQVAIDAKISDYLQLVLAAPEPLEALLHAVMLTLLHDAQEDSTISVRAVQGEGDLTIRFANEGFGMPQEKLDRYLIEGAGGHETLERIGAGLITVGAWGGSLSVRSEVGAGMNFELKLVSVI